MPIPRIPGLVTLLGLQTLRNKTIASPTITTPSITSPTIDSFVNALHNHSNAAGGGPVTLSTITASLGADVNLNNTGTFFTGPEVAQGSSGTWFASGIITVKDTAGAANINVQLWDGTTVIASGNVHLPSIDVTASVSLSGYIASPAGNIRISAKDVTSTSGLIIYNFTGTTKDSTVTAIRIA